MSTLTRIAELRAERGLSQTQLAMKIGCTLSMLGKLERGERTVSLPWLQKVADALGVAVGELLPGPGGDLLDLSRLKPTDRMALVAIYRSLAGEC